MFKQEISSYIWGGPAGKYRLVDQEGKHIDKTPEDTCKRVADALSDVELENKEKWQKEFYNILGTKFAGGGRIMANAGAKNVKKEVSLINCTLSSQLPDGIGGILDIAKEAALTLKAGCGIGYDFSPLRPKGAYVFGAGAGTSGVVSFMKIFDTVCSTILSGGGRRGSQMGTLDIQHPDIEEFITAKRQDGVLRYFNVSVLITDKFMNAVKNDEKWDLWFWEKNRTGKEINAEIKIIKKNDIPFNYPSCQYFSFAEDHTEVQYQNCTVKDVFIKKVYKTVKAKYLFDLITRSTYEFNDPGFMLIDKINQENNLWFCEPIRATNPCGEVPLGSGAVCLLGSVILPSYIKKQFTSDASFDWEQYKKDIKTANRLLDNVVEVNNLPLKIYDETLRFQRRHGLGITGLGSLFNMMGVVYGSQDSADFAEKIMLIMAQESLLTSIEIAKEKGCAPFVKEEKNRKLYMQSGYMKRLLNSFDNKKEIEEDILKYGVRWSHSLAIAPTGTLSLTFGNNCSNGIEPVFSNSYLRNIRIAGKKTKMQVEVLDYAYFEWKQLYKDKPLPSHWRITDNLSVDDHIIVQAAMQKWCDAAISKTINVPTDYPFEEFKNVYFKGWEQGLKGITTYRYNPAVISGVLVQEDDLKNTNYTFILDNGEELTVSGNEEIEYDGEMHNAANLFDALKEGLYGNM